jgi:MFS family permease
VLADRVGRKKIFVPSLVLFGIAGTDCAFARDFNLLLWFLFLQGIGAASLHSLTIALISDLYSGTRRTTAIGLQHQYHHCQHGNLFDYWRRIGSYGLVLSLFAILGSYPSSTAGVVWTQKS